MIGFLFLVFHFLCYWSACCLAANQQCGNTTTFCGQGSECCTRRYSPTTFGCRLHNNHTSCCCKPGPALEPVVDKFNCLVLGDSVSIGYTRYATLILQDVCQVQHAPYDIADGGAEDTQTGIDCLQNFLKTQRQTRVAWDVIVFNFGLHDLDTNTTVYANNLRILVDNLKAYNAPTTQLMYALTTPYMPRRSVVLELNEAATSVMLDHGVPILDLYALITGHCGTDYKQCDWCHVPHACSFHYSSLGYENLGALVAHAILGVLNKPADMPLIAN